MRMQQVDRPAELLHQDLTLNCLPPAFFVLFWGCVCVCVCGGGGGGGQSI